VASYLSWPVDSCCDDSCREGDLDAPSPGIERSVPCCDIDRHIAPTRSRVLVPDRKSGPTDTCGDPSERFDVYQTDVLVVTASPSTSASRRPISTPLRI
jgi:hypothetical protein